MKTEFQEKQQQQMEEMHAKQAQAIEETTVALEVASRASTPSSGSRPGSRASSVQQTPLVQQEPTPKLENDFQQHLLLQQQMAPAPSYAMAAPMR